MGGIACNCGRICGAGGSVVSVVDAVAVGAVWHGTWKNAVAV
jgi:hypothetical protein